MGQINWQKRYEEYETGDKVLVISNETPYDKGKIYTLHSNYLKNERESYWSTEENKNVGMLEKNFEKVLK